MKISPEARKCIIQYAACMSLVALVLWFMRDQLHEFRAIERVRAWTIFWVSIFFIMSQVLAGVVLKLLVAVFSINLVFREWFGLICIRSIGNYLPLSAGLTANAAYLKTERGLPVSKFASLMTANLVLGALAGSLLGAILSLWRYSVTGDVQLALPLFFIAIIVIALAVIFFPLRLVSLEGRVMGWLRSVHIGWETIRCRRRLLVTVVLLHFSILTLIALQYGFVLKDMNCALDWRAIMIMTVATNIIRFASLFPGNLGLRETVAGGVTQAFGLPFSVGLLASTISRIVSMFWILLLGVVFIVALLHSRRVRTIKTASGQDATETT